MSLGFKRLTGTQHNCENLIEKTRKLLATQGQHHPMAVVDRLSVPRKQEDWNGVVGRSLSSKGYGTDGICGQQRRSSNTDC